MEWYQNGILSIQGLSTTTGQPLGQLPLYKFNTNFLHYYQVIIAIPKNLLNMARNETLLKKGNFTLIIPLISARRIYSN